jgi:hypothetical protein
MKDSPLNIPTTIPMVVALHSPVGFQANQEIKESYSAGTCR